MSESQPKVSVVILSHDRPALLRSVIDSVVAQTYQHLEIIVVDNRSRASEEIARLVGSYAGVRLVRNDSNLWYTGGMNRGLAAATGHYIHFMVDDVQLDPDCISHLVEYAESHPSAGLLSGIMYYEDRRTILFAGGEFALGGIYRKKVYGEGQPDVGQFREPFKVSCVDGAMIFSRLEFIRQLKGFREDFLIYLDSIELSARALKLGKEIVIVPQAKTFVTNAPHAFTDRGIAFHKIKNLFAFYLLHARARVLPEFFCRYALLALARAALSKNGNPRALLKALVWVARRTPSLLRERAVQGRDAN
jgi:GT2 family glycosyltransferase